MVEVRYYLFDVNDTVVKAINDERWYKRDKIKHEWIEDGAWEFFFYDPGFGVKEIDYDEEQEEIKELDPRRS